MNAQCVVDFKIPFFNTPIGGASHNAICNILEYIENLQNIKIKQEFCPNKKYHINTMHMFDSFRGLITSRIKKLYTLPTTLIHDLCIEKLQYKNGEFTFENSGSIQSNIELFLNNMIASYPSYCFSQFRTDIPLLFSLRDELHTNIIDHFINTTQYIDPQCQDVECTKKLYSTIVENAPIFVFSKETDKKGGYYIENNKFLFMDPYITSTRFRGTISSSVNGSNKYHWAEKENKAFWRGQDGMSSYDHHSYSVDGALDDAFNNKYPRLGLVLTSIKTPNLIDAKFSNIAHSSKITQLLTQKRISESIDSENFNQILENSIIDLVDINQSDSQTVEEHIKYKYLISVDGWTAAWGRPEWILRSNCLLLKHDSSKVQWFYGDMKDNMHYKSFNSDFSNLESTILWLNDNKNEARYIADEGSKFYEQNFSDEALVETAYTIINDYFDSIE